MDDLSFLSDHQAIIPFFSQMTRLASNAETAVTAT